MDTDKLVDANVNYIAYFNKYLIDFLTELKNIFPELAESIDLNYSNITDTSTEYIAEFMQNISKYSDKIAQKDDSLFTKTADNKKVVLLRDINFIKLWHSGISDNTKQAIWKYLHTLTILGSYSDDNSEIVQQVFKQLSSMNLTPDAIDEQAKNIMNMMSNIKTTTDKPSDTQSAETPPPSADKNSMDDMLSGSTIGKLAQEISQEIDMSSLDLNDPGKLMSSLLGGKADGNNGLMELIKNVSSKVATKLSNGNVNQKDLLSEAQAMMSGLQGSGAGNLFSPDMMKNLQQMMGGNSESAPKAKPNHNNGAAQQKERLRQKLAKRKQDQ
jgi:hypothetical protein